MDGGGGGDGSSSSSSSNSSNGNFNTTSMNRRSDNKRTHSTMTDSHRSSSSSALFSSHPHRLPYDDHYNNEHRARRSGLQLAPLEPRNRFVGDGLDYRRPVMSVAGSPSRNEAQLGGEVEMIDLTREVAAEPSQHPVSRVQRLPRYGRDIIDISSSEDEAEAARPMRPTTNLPGMSRPPITRLQSIESMVRRYASPLFVHNDDIEFMGSRSLSRATSRNVSAIPGALDPARDGPGNRVIDLTQDADEDLAVIDARSLPALNRRNPIMSGSTGVRAAANPAPSPGFPIGNLIGILGNGRLFGRIAQAHHDAFNMRSLHQLDQSSRYRYQQNHVPPNVRGFGSFADRASRMDPQPIEYRPYMDYEAPAFDIGTGARRSPTPCRYETPEPPAPGFTRNPGEDEEVVCPNCGSELAMGDEDAQRQIWVIKQCGHAYCGSCVQARLRSTARKGQRDKGKQRADAGAPPMLKKCVIDGCAKAVNKSSMVHVFLSD